MELENRLSGKCWGESCTYLARLENITIFQVPTTCEQLDFTASGEQCICVAVVLLCDCDNDNSRLWRNCADFGLVEVVCDVSVILLDLYYSNKDPETDRAYVVLHPLTGAAQCRAQQHSTKCTAARFSARQRTMQQSTAAQCSRAQQHNAAQHSSTVQHSTAAQCSTVLRPVTRGCADCSSRNCNASGSDLLRYYQVLCCVLLCAAVLLCCVLLCCAHCYMPIAHCAVCPSRCVARNSVKTRELIYQIACELFHADHEMLLSLVRTPYLSKAAVAPAICIIQIANVPSCM